MDIYEEILKTFSFSIIIWKHKEDKYICKFSNKNDNLAYQGMELEKYLENNAIMKPLYKKIFENKEEQRLITNNQNIVVYSILDVYYEVRNNMTNQMSKYIHLSYISNQIRGPLTTTMAAISTLYDIGLTTKQRAQINLIEKSNFELISLANDIVDVINLSKNDIKLHLESNNLKKYITEAIEIVNYYSQNKKVNINLKIDPMVPLILSFDGQRLKQILINILTISLKNTEQGSININVSLFNEPLGPYDHIKVEAPKYNILFKIKDTCNGISSIDANSMKGILGINDSEFKNYYNFEFALVISKYLSNLMCGNLWFENEPEFGVIYYFNLIA